MYFNFFILFNLIFRNGDIDDPKDCFYMLMASCQQSDCEDLIFDIFLRLLLITDKIYKRHTYFKMIQMCITEIAFSDMGYGPEFNHQIVFNTPLGINLIIYFYLFLNFKMKLLNKSIMKQYLIECIKGLKQQLAQSKKLLLCKTLIIKR